MTFDTSPAYWKSKVVWRWIFSLPFLRKHNLTHPNYKWGQDVCFMYDCLLRAKRFSQCEQFLYYFRQDHKNAETTVDVKVEHQLAHYVEVKRILTRTPDGIVRYKPLVKYLNENYWRDVRKLAPLLTGEDERWLRPALEIGRELFDGLDPSWFRAAALSPEVREQTEFLPLVDAFIRNDMDAANTIFLELRNNPPHVVDKNTPFHVLRHKIKAMFNPLSRHAKAQLRALETLAASRT